MTAFDPDLTDDEEPTTEIVHWYEDSPWRVQFVPTAVAFGAGLAAGVLGTLLALRLLDDD